LPNLLYSLGRSIHPQEPFSFFDLIARRAGEGTELFVPRPQRLAIETGRRDGRQEPKKYRDPKATYKEKACDFFLLS
jgi:hypothetical protein